MSAIKEANTIYQVVEIINDCAGTGYFGGTDTREADEQAGEWAADAALEAGFTDSDSIEYHLNYLENAGAKFDFNRAFEFAKRFVSKSKV